MAIEKLDFDNLIKEHTPFTTVLNSVVQNIGDHFAGFIWIYLCTLPPQWKVNKYHLMKHFDIGEQKLKKHMAYLASMNLIRYIRPRNTDGTLAPVSIEVLCGYEFLNKESTTCTNDTTGMKNHLVVEPPSGESSTYKRNTSLEKKDLYKNNISESEDSCSSNKKVVKKPSLVPAETLVEVYHQTLPASPRIEVIEDELERILKNMQKQWVKIPPKKEPFTIEAFIQHLVTIKTHHPGFLQKYKTKAGNMRLNSLENIARFKNIAGFYNTTLDFRKSNQ